MFAVFLRINDGSSSSDLSLPLHDHSSMQRLNVVRVNPYWNDNENRCMTLLACPMSMPVLKFILSQLYSPWQPTIRPNSRHTVYRFVPCSYDAFCSRGAVGGRVHGSGDHLAPASDVHRIRANKVWNFLLSPPTAVLYSPVGTGRATKNQRKLSIISAERSSSFSQLMSQCLTQHFTNLQCKIAGSYWF